MKLLAADGIVENAEMYQDYIDGRKEIRDINMEFRAQYESGTEAPERDQEREFITCYGD